MSGEKNRCSGYSRLSVSNRWIYINISRLTKSVGAMAASFVRALQATDKFVDQISGLSTVAKVEAARIKVLCNLVEKLAQWKAEDASAACAAINATQALKMVSKRLLLEHFTRTSWPLKRRWKRKRLTVDLPRLGPSCRTTPIWPCFFRVIYGQRCLSLSGLPLIA